MPTAKEMCETIVRAMKKRDPNVNVLPEDVFNLSPTGELWYLPAMYIEAKADLGELTEEDQQNEMVQNYLAFKEYQEKKHHAR